MDSVQKYEFWDEGPIPSRGILFYLIMYYVTMVRINKSMKEYELKQLKYSQNPKHCKQCDILIPYLKRRHDFCNHSCASIFSRKNDNKLLENSSVMVKINLDELRLEYYKNDCNVEELAERFSISPSTLLKILDKIIIIRRPTKRRKKRKITDDERIRHSACMKKLHASGGHPGWCSVNSKKEDSYPEKRFKEFLIKNEITNKFTIFSKFQVSKYCLDFVLMELKINIELDGQYHFHDKATIEKDIRRDEYMKLNGWRVFRVSWTKFRDHEAEVLAKLNTFINDISTTTTKLYSEKDLLIDCSIKINEFSNKITKIKKCIKCGCEITQYSKCCRKCVDHTHPMIHKRKFEISKEELATLLKTTSRVKIGKLYGVSDNAIKKRAISYGLLGNKT